MGRSRAESRREWDCGGGRACEWACEGEPKDGKVCVGKTRDARNGIGYIEYNFPYTAECVIS